MAETLLHEDKDFEVLPVEAFQDEIMDAVRRSQIIICTGETGSGKTTQLPKYFMKAGYGKGGKLIGVTQPRRIAAISVAQRVSDELGVAIGQDIGYVVRFEEKMSDRTQVKYMTDGILIRECLSDRALSQYDLIMIDEAHERSLNTDILFGLLKECCRLRSDLKIVITSATLDTVKFGTYFNNCPIIAVPGRNFPVDIYHSKTKQIMTASGPANNAYIQAAVDVVLKIHRREAEGHILVFLTGQEEIERACQAINEALEGDNGSEGDGKSGGSGAMDDRELLVLPLYAALSNDIQSRVFQKAEYLWEQQQHQKNNKRPSSSTTSPKFIRKVIVATNIAETSITVPQVRFVVDAGYVKQKVFDPERGVESLLVVPISKTASLQRAGRAGRTGPGQCYRLYSSDCFNEMIDETIPEIQRTSLGATVLYLKALNISDVLHFDFLDPPSSEQVIQALYQLYMLEALDAHGRITPLGRAMSQYPLEPPLARMLLQSATPQCACLEDMVIICAMLSVENVWVTPRNPARFNHNNSRNRDDPSGSNKSRDNNAYQSQYTGFGAHRNQNGGSLPQRKNNHYAVQAGERGDRDRDSAWTLAEERAETAHAGLRHPSGDLHTLFRIYDQWRRCDFEFKWCERHFVSLRAMKQAKRIAEHLAEDVRKHRLDRFMHEHSSSNSTKAGLTALSGKSSSVTASTSSGSHSSRDQLQPSKKTEASSLRWEERISEAILSAYYMQAAVTCYSETLYKITPLPRYSSTAKGRKRSSGEYFLLFV